MEIIDTKFAIVVQRTSLQLHISSDICDAPLDQSESANRMPVYAGTLLQIHSNQELAAGKNYKKPRYIVQIRDYKESQAIYENLYECPRSHIHLVDEHLWPFVIAIAAPERRLQFLKQSVQKLQWITNLKPLDLVSVQAEALDKSNGVFDCVIRHIGYVPQMSSYGYFFGLELLHLNSGISPQSEQIPFSIECMGVDPSLALFVTADNIDEIRPEVKRKTLPFNLSEALDKVRLYFSLENSYSTNSLNRKKTKISKEPSAQFYTNRNTLNASETDSAAAAPKTSTMKRSEASAASKVQSNNFVLPDDNEEYTQSIAKYEKQKEKEHLTNASKGSNNNSSTCNNNNSGNNNNIPSILKHSTRSASKKAQAPELIVIDDEDIRESTKNENNVVVVKPIADVDLVQVLGGNWPTVAGEQANILNNTANAAGSNTSGKSKAERNKSPNLLSHISNATRSVGSNYNLQESSGFINIREPQHNEIAAPPPAYDNDYNYHTINSDDESMQDVPDTDLGVGSVVELALPDVKESLYGVIRWIGVPQGHKFIMVGVELEDENGHNYISKADKHRILKCHDHRLLLVSPQYCWRDRRFANVDMAGAAAADIGAAGDGKHVNGIRNHSSDGRMFGQVDCPIVAGAVAPLRIASLEDLEQACGKFKGIQGHNNSCYLDATLFSMFMFTSVFDSLLFRPPEKEDVPEYTTVQKVLREEIVNPLRKNVFVRADRVMKLRELLDKLSSVSGLTSEEKDPEEFLNSLLAQIMRVEPFLKLNSGQDSYFYQLFVEKDERLVFPTVQQLFEQSFHASDIKLKEVPSCLIIQMPRFGKSYKMYPRILPSQFLDVTNIIEDSPRVCIICGNLAGFECRECWNTLPNSSSLDNTAFCQKCIETAHGHPLRAKHKYSALKVPDDFLQFMQISKGITPPRLYMELFAVVCIETSHYVAFVKAGSGPDAPWCFFDSMADRKGELNGYNVPEMLPLPDMAHWLTEEGARSLNDAYPNEKLLPEHAKRLFCDSYMCMYQSTDVMMYR